MGDGVMPLDGGAIVLEERFDASLRWLDCAIEREVMRLRGRYELSLDELRGLYISDSRVDDLLRERLAPASDGDPARELSDRAKALHAQYCAGSPMRALGEQLELSEEELDLVLVALAPEIDLRYQTLYAYLNNDAARKYPTLDLARRLLAGSRYRGELSAATLRALLAPRSRLFVEGVLEPLDPAERGSSLHQGFMISPVIAQALLGLPLADARWPREVHWIATGAAPRGRVEHGGAPRAFFVLVGENQEELRCAARDIATAQNWPLIAVPVTVLARDPTGTLADGIRLAARLVGGAVLVEAAGIATDEGMSAAARLALDCAREATPLMLLADARSAGAQWIAELAHVRVEPKPLDIEERRAHWKRALMQSNLATEDSVIERLAASFTLSVSRIEAAVESAALRWKAPAAIARAGDADAVRTALEREASARSNEALAGLATRVLRADDWGRLVLPHNALQQLNEIAAAIENRERVYRGWGLIERTGTSAGLMIFFTGASGTGKTMAASVVANSAGLELYRIDLASVVSKYIGETEKNLERIFSAARHSSAILLFDEADALLGKRSEIKDAHDRYANIEVAYLLQKMEEHDGVVILSSNLPKNLDPAFARRMHYLLEFAKPNAALRERLWKGMYPPSAPLRDDIDFRFLADRFETTGGEIQAIALDAAFLAAADDSPISMHHLMHAMTRRQTKQGNSGGWARYREHCEALEARPPVSSGA
jgi:hypothetical protein